ncbi:MAG: selenocysteine-specific translation elongation factor [Solirubrobacteraceae bacterium]
MSRAPEPSLPAGADGGPAPVVIGTAGHIDHGKTALVAALTGVDTDRLPEEKRRGISIALGYAPLCLPSGRPASIVDVPGHERLVRTMVAGATGIDLFLLVIAADDGPMPQTHEHVRVLDALGLRNGIVVITKSDLADPTAAMAAAQRLLPDARIVACSARAGRGGVQAVARALDAAAARLSGRSRATAGALLHIDRAFTIRGAGTVVTGTLWAGSIARGDQLVILPAERRARVRGVHVHDAPRERAHAGQRVAVNLAGIDLAAVGRGDVLADPAAGLHPSFVLDVVLSPCDVSHGDRVHVHHGTRGGVGRLIHLADDLWQIRAERPLIAAAGDRLVIRRISPPDTLGGGVILNPAARKHGRAPELIADLRRRQSGEPEPAVASRPAPSATSAISLPELSADALALERRLLEAGTRPPTEAELGPAAVELPALRAHGRAIRVGRTMHAHPDGIATARSRVQTIIAGEGSVTLGRLRDELGISRRHAQALLEHLDAARVTRRLPDDRRVLRRPHMPRSGTDPRGDAGSDSV